MTTATIQNNKLVVKKEYAGAYKGSYKGYNFNIWFNNDELKMWLMSVERENSTYYLNDYANTKSYGIEMIIDIIDNNFYE